MAAMATGTAAAIEFGDGYDGDDGLLSGRASNDHLDSIRQLPAKFAGGPRIRVESMMPADGLRFDAFGDSDDDEDDDEDDDDDVDVGLGGGGGDDSRNRMESTLSTDGMRFDTLGDSGD